MQLSTSNETEIVNITCMQAKSFTTQAVGRLFVSSASTLLRAGVGCVGAHSTRDSHPGTHTASPAHSHKHDTLRAQLWPSC